MKDIERVNPDPKIVALLDFALDEVLRLIQQNKAYAEWVSWARTWKAGERQPFACVEIAHKCFAHEEDRIFHCLGQLAWGAKEACYSTPKSGWLVVGYVADAMLAFGVKFSSVALPRLEPPTIAAEPLRHLNG